MREIKQFFRPAYEVYTVIIGVMVLLFLGYIHTQYLLPKGVFWMGYLFVGWVTLKRFYQCIKQWAFRTNVLTPRLEFIDFQTLVKKTKKNAGYLFCGYGFEWWKDHFVIVSDYFNSPKQNIHVPGMVKRLMILYFCRFRNPANKGARLTLIAILFYIFFNNKKIEFKGYNIFQILEPQKDALTPIESLKGHTIIFGTTGSGKTRLYDLIVTQAILRGDVVIVLDPKGDKELLNNVKRACELSGREFLYFHPGFPEQSIRFDPLANFSRKTAVASRLAALLPSVSGGNDPFVAFAWRFLNAISNGLIFLDERPTLVSLGTYIQGHFEPLVERVITRYLDENNKGWRTSSALGAIRTQLRAGKAPANEADVLSRYYNEVVMSGKSTEKRGNAVVSEIINIYMHSREHMQKMIASLLPIMTMLTSDQLESMLSPEEIEGDYRIKTNSREIINNGQVLFLGLDSLSDQKVSSAIGSIVLADFCSVAGDRYNYEVNNSDISMFIDEANEVINGPTITLLNKGRGAGFSLYLATQTKADLVAMLGNDARALQVLGNGNNVISLRIIDPDTASFVQDKMLLGTKMLINYSQTTNISPGNEATGGYSESISQGKDTPMFTAQWLQRLPDLQGIIVSAGGKVQKFQIPILKM